MATNEYSEVLSLCVPSAWSGLFGRIAELRIGRQRAPESQVFGEGVADELRHRRVDSIFTIRLSSVFLHMRTSAIL